MTHNEKMNRLRRAVELSNKRSFIYGRSAEGPELEQPILIYGPNDPNFPQPVRINPYTEVLRRAGQPDVYRDYNRQRIFDALGVKEKGDKIPKSAKGVAEVEGVRFVLHEHVGHKSGRKSSKHRLYASCPVCGKDIPTGRMRQHAVVHNENRPLKMSKARSGGR